MSVQEKRGGLWRVARVVAVADNLCRRDGAVVPTRRFGGHADRERHLVFARRPYVGNAGGDVIRKASKPQSMLAGASLSRALKGQRRDKARILRPNQRDIIRSFVVWRRLVPGYSGRKPQALEG